MELNTSKIDLTNDSQKVFAGILLLAGLFVLYWALPPLIYIMQNLYVAIGLGLGLSIMVLCRASIWAGVKQLSWSITKGIISSNKLWHMYRYHNYLLGKIKSLEGSILSVGGIKTKLSRKASDLKIAITQNANSAIFYEQKKAPETAIRTFRNKVAIDEKQLDNLMPKLVSIDSQMKHLTELHDLWKADTEDLKYTLDAKAEEYELLKELNTATGNASEFLKGNSEEYKNYQESLRQIEVSVSQYTANIENFERQARPLIDNLSMERSVSEDTGAKLIEEFKKNSISLKLEEVK